MSAETSRASAWLSLIKLRVKVPEQQTQHPDEVPNDARRAQRNIMQPVLPRHQSRNQKHAALITQDRLADPRHTRCNREAGIALCHGKPPRDRHAPSLLSSSSCWEGRSSAPGYWASGIPATCAALHTATDESPCSPITAAWTERGSTSSFSPRMWRRRSVSSSVPEPMIWLCRQARFFMSNKGEHVDRIRCNQQDAVETFSHQLLNASAHDKRNVARQHVQARPAELHRYANRHNDDGTRRRVLVSSSKDLHRSAERNSLLEIQRLTVHVGLCLSDQDDLASKMILQQAVGTGGPNMPAADDRYPRVLGHRYPLVPNILPPPSPQQPDAPSIDECPKYTTRPANLPNCKIRNTFCAS